MTVAEWAGGAVGVLFFVGIGNLVAGLALARLRVPYCPECDHCRREDRERKERQEQEQRRWADELWNNRRKRD